MKKLLSILLAVVFALSCFSVISYAEEIKFEKCPEDAGSIVKVPDGVTTICENAFDGCANVKQIYIPESVKTIEENAFVNCGVREILINGTELSVSGKIVDEPSLVTVIIRNSKNNLEDNIENKRFIAQSGFNWFAFDEFKIFGKSVIAFFYEPKLNDETMTLINCLADDCGANYICFYSSETDKQTFVKPGADTNSIENGSAISNPGLFVRIIIKICSGKIIDKSNYDGHAGVKGITSLIYKLFFKKK